MKIEKRSATDKTSNQRKCYLSIKFKFAEQKN